MTYQLSLREANNYQNMIFSYSPMNGIRLRCQDTPYNRDKIQQNIDARKSDESIKTFEELKNLNVFTMPDVLKTDHLHKYRIGVFGRYIHEVNIFMNENFEKPDRIMRYYSGTDFIYNDGTIITGRIADEECRGSRFDELYINILIKNEIINNILIPCLLPREEGNNITYWN